MNLSVDDVQPLLCLKVDIFYRGEFSAVQEVVVSTPNLMQRLKSGHVYIINYDIKSRNFRTAQDPHEGGD